MNLRHHRSMVSIAASLGLLASGCDLGQGPCGNSPSFYTGGCSGGKISLRTGQTATFEIYQMGNGKPVGSLGAGEDCPVEDATWTSSNAGVASVEGRSTGTVRAISVGTTEITAVVKWNAGTTGSRQAQFLTNLGSPDASSCSVTVTN